MPRSFAAEIRKEQATLATEIIREIRQQVPEFARPLSGNFGSGIQHGVETALAEFADLVDGAGSRAGGRTRGATAGGSPGGTGLNGRRTAVGEAGAGPEPTTALAPARTAPGAGPQRGADTRLPRARARELAEGRSLDALQAAYRLGARVAWRRYARVARRVGLGPDLVVTLAEAIFAHIDEIASASVEGYTEARADRAGAQGQLRHRLLEQLVAGAQRAEAEQAAVAADWPLPERVACVALGPAVPTAAVGAGCPIRSWRIWSAPIRICWSRTRQGC
ncbi:hypothetical protein GXW82_05980 [Streptacidiphilus sp. 4-A2]|nr:hypothetical protein [Streptacidiphilus sp. 4-A2]